MESKKDPVWSAGFFKHEKTSQSSSSHNKKNLEAQSIPIEQHFHDQSMRPLDEFKTMRSKEGTVPGGVMEHIKSKNIFLIKENKLGFTCFNVNEFVMGPIYKRLLYDRAPVIALVESPTKEQIFAIRSKFLFQFKDLEKFMEGVDSEKRPDLLKEIKGAEKLFAAMLIGAESDPQPANMGVMNIGSPTAPEYVYAKIDHGQSGTQFFSNPTTMLAFLNEILGGKYDPRIPIDARLLESAMNAMVSIKDEEVQQLISNRIQQLRNLQFDPAQVDFFMYNDGEPKEIRFENLDSLEKHYIERLKNQLKVVRECCKMLAIIRTIKVPDQESWLSSGQWLADLNGEDPVAWAKRNGFPVEEPKDYKSATPVPRKA